MKLLDSLTFETAFNRPFYNSLFIFVAKSVVKNKIFSISFILFSYPLLSFLRLQRYHTFGWRPWARWALPAPLWIRHCNSYALELKIFELHWNAKVLSSQARRKAPANSGWFKAEASLKMSLFIIFVHVMLMWPGSGMWHTVIAEPIRNVHTIFTRHLIDLVNL